MYSFCTCLCTSICISLFHGLFALICITLGSTFSFLYDISFLRIELPLNSRLLARLCDWLICGVSNLASNGWIHFARANILGHFEYIIWWIHCYIKLNSLCFSLFCNDFIKNIHNWTILVSEVLINLSYTFILNLISY